MQVLRVRSGDALLAGLRFGSGPPLLLTHPLVFSKAFVAAGGDVLGARFDVATFDQRGHGESEGGAIEATAMADDLGAEWMNSCNRVNRNDEHCWPLLKIYLHFTPPVGNNIDCRFVWKIPPARHLQSLSCLVQLLSGVNPTNELA